MRLAVAKVVKTFGNAHVAIRMQTATFTGTVARAHQHVSSFKCLDVARFPLLLPSSRRDLRQ
jgi:hypothetical protein